MGGLPDVGGYLVPMADSWRAPGLYPTVTPQFITTTCDLGFANDGRDRSAGGADR